MTKPLWIKTNVLLALDWVHQLLWLLLGFLLIAFRCVSKAGALPRSLHCVISRLDGLLFGLLFGFVASEVCGLSPVLGTAGRYSLIIVSKKLLRLVRLWGVDVFGKHGNIKSLAVLLPNLDGCSLIHRRHF